MITMIDDLARFKADLLNILVPSIAAPEKSSIGDDDVLTYLMTTTMPMGRFPSRLQQRPSTNDKVAALEVQTTDVVV